MATCGSLIMAFIERWLLYRGRLQCFSAMLVLFRGREAGGFRKMAAFTVTILITTYGIPPQFSTPRYGCRQKALDYSTALQ